MKSRPLGTNPNAEVSVLGAAGGIGQPLSLLMKLNPRVTALTCFDVAPVTPGVAADLSHIATGAKTTGFTGDGLKKALGASRGPGAGVISTPPFLLCSCFLFARVACDDRLRRPQKAA